MSKPTKPDALDYVQAINLLVNFSKTKNQNELSEKNKPEYDCAPNTGPMCLDTKTVAELLFMLKQKLLDDKNTINPYGTLAKCINTIQDAHKLDIMNISVINKTIEAYNLRFNAEVTQTNNKTDETSFVDRLNLVNYTEDGTIVNPDTIQVKVTTSTQEKLFLSKTQLKEQQKIKAMLSKLKQDLLEAGKEINPYGKLAKCIEHIQATSHLQIIDMHTINTEIKNNVLKND